MSSITLSQLIKKSLLISPDMKEDLTRKITTFTEFQHQEMIEAIEASEKDLEQILDHAISNDPKKLTIIQQKLDDVWKRYVKEVEKVSESAETTQEQVLLDQLDQE